jgi:hypothetical protein
LQRDHRNVVTSSRPSTAFPPFLLPHSGGRRDARQFDWF